MSRILDSDPQIYRLVHADLLAGGINPRTGRDGLTAEQVLRALIVKQMNEFDYRELEFHLRDSACYQAFCRIGYDQRPSSKTLQRNIKKVRAETLEAVNRLVLKEAGERGVENGRTVRTDCTVEETNIHHPTDASLLYDVVRVLTRLLHQARQMGFELELVDHRRRAKRRMVEVEHGRRERQRVKGYRELLQLAEEAMDYAIFAIPTLEYPAASMELKALLLGPELTKELEHYIGLGRRVVEQTRRRVLQQEQVEARDKVVSIFEPHTDIIVKDRRETLFGHKVCLTTGKSGLVLDCQVLTGNPADSRLAVRAMERQQEIFGRVPRQASFDGGFASKSNLVDIKEMGVKDVMFHKKRGLAVPEMAKSSWVYRKLKRFRAGIEGGISFLKRCFGLSRCLWRGESSFKAYTWASVVSANVLMLARHALS